MWMDAAKYSAYAAGLQAVGLLVAFIVGMATLAADGRDRRVDRVYALHQEYYNPPISDARRRLHQFIREDAPSGVKRRRVPLAELRADPTLNRYKDANSAAESTPLQDVSSVLRFFERARLVQLSGSADDPVFVELIG